MWLFYEIIEIPEIDFSTEVITPFVFTNKDDVILFSTNKFNSYTQHDGYIDTCSKLNNKEINIDIVEPYIIYEAHISNKVYNGNILKLEYYLEQT